MTELLFEANNLFFDFIDASLRLKELRFLLCLELSFFLNDLVKLLDLLHLLANSILTALHLSVKIVGLLLLNLHFV